MPGRVMISHHHTAARSWHLSPGVTCHHWSPAVTCPLSCALFSMMARQLCNRLVGLLTRDFLKVKLNCQALATNSSRATHYDNADTVSRASLLSSRTSTRLGKKPLRFFYFNQELLVRNKKMGEREEGKREENLNSQG